MKNRRAHGLLVFLAFTLLMFSTQFFFYIVHQVRTAEQGAQVHLLVRQKEAPAFGEYRDRLGLHHWQWFDLATWGDAYQTLWKDVVHTTVKPDELFEGKAEGVWVADLPPMTWSTLLHGHPSITKEKILTEKNVVNVLGYPRWESELYTWFWTWSSLCLVLICVAAAMLLSAVMADMTLLMTHDKLEVQVKYTLGATFAQLRRPLVQKTLYRSAVLLLCAVGVNILFYATLIYNDLLSVDWVWAQRFTVISLMAVICGACVVWVSARRSFQRTLIQWDI